jgi:hypothetical protein
VVIILMEVVDIAAVFRLFVLSRSFSLVLVFVSVFVAILVAVRVPNGIVRLTVLHMTMVFIVFTPGRFLTLVNKSTVSFSIPSALVTLVLVLAIGGVPISWTFKFAGSFVGISVTVIMTMFGGQIATGDELFTISGCL